MSDYPQGYTVLYTSPDKSPFISIVKMLYEFIRVAARYFNLGR